MLGGWGEDYGIVRFLFKLWYGRTLDFVVLGRERTDACISLGWGRWSTRKDQWKAIFILMEPCVWVKEGRSGRVDGSFCAFLKDNGAGLGR